MPPGSNRPLLLCPGAGVLPLGRKVPSNQFSMLSKILIAPLVLAALVFLYLSWEVDTDWSYYLLPCAIGAAIVYVFSPQLDWWWSQRHPPDLPEALRQMLEKRLPYYQRLTEPLRARFRQRTALYIKAHDFKAQRMEQVPADIQAVIAATAVQLTFGQEDFLMKPFEFIIVYPHPFPSPQYPTQWHASEIYEEDGVILFSAEQLMPGFFLPEKHFHIGLYEYARVFRLVHPFMTWPDWSEEDWQGLEAVSGMTHQYVTHLIGLDDIDVTAVAVVYFYVFPERFRQHFQHQYEVFMRNFYPQQSAQQHGEKETTGAPGQVAADAGKA